MPKVLPDRLTEFQAFLVANRAMAGSILFEITKLERETGVDANPRRLKRLKERLSALDADLKARCFLEEAVLKAKSNRSR
jgi:hypothetical protein